MWWKTDRAEPDVASLHRSFFLNGQRNTNTFLSLDFFFLKSFKRQNRSKIRVTFFFLLLLNFRLYFIFWVSIFLFFGLAFWKHSTFALIHFVNRAVLQQLWWAIHLKLLETRELLCLKKKEKETPNNVAREVCTDATSDRKQKKGVFFFLKHGRRVGPKYTKKSSMWAGLF